MDKTRKVLFLSKGSASRSHMAEGLLRALAGDQYQPYSAGTDAPAVHPVAIAVMSEVGIDISTQKSRDVRSLFQDTFQYVVVLSDPSRERSPVYPFTRNLLKWSVPDPETAIGGPEIKTLAFRQTRDQMRAKVEELLQTMDQRTPFTNVRSAAA